jgi:hypothetical protein
MQMTCPAPRRDIRYGEFNVDFTGPVEMRGPEISQARIAWPSLAFCEGTENNTWTLTFDIWRRSTVDNATTQCSIQVLPRSGNDRHDVKPVTGVYKQVAPDGPVADNA